MFWLVGLMGLMAVCALAFADAPAFDEADASKELPDDPPLVPLGAWRDQAGTVADVLDFEEDRDALVFVWDDSNTDNLEPRINIAASSDDAELFEVMSGTKVIAIVSSETELTAADIALLPLSSAQSLWSGVPPTLQ